MQVKHVRAHRVFAPGAEVFFRCLHRTLGEPWHDHDFFEMLLVNSGLIWHLQEGQRRLLAEGTVIFMRPGDVHRFDDARDPRYSSLVLAFRPSAFEAVCDCLRPGFSADLYTGSRLSPIFAMNADEKAHWSARFLTIGRYLSRSEPLARAVFRSTLAELLTRFFLERRTTAEPVIPAWLTSTCQAMRKKGNFIDGLEALRRLAHKSNGYIARAFKRHLGKTPSQFVNEIRLDYAADLLATTRVKVAAVAGEAGYSDLSHFYRLFKERFGVPPGEFRRNVQVETPFSR